MQLILSEIHCRLINFVSNYTHSFTCCSLSTPGILGRITDTRRLVVADLIERHTDVLEGLVEILAPFSECDGAVMRIALLNEDMAVERGACRQPCSAACRM